MGFETRRLRRRFSALSARSGLLRRALVGLCAVLVLTVMASPARAAVPMCSSDGRSVIAPPIVLPWKVRTLEAGKPCQQPENPLLRAMPEQQQKAPSTSPSPAPLRAMPLRSSALPAPARARTSIERALPPASTRLVVAIYRPPRA